MACGESQPCSRSANYPLQALQVYAWLGVKPPRGLLLHGPPGCGKTALANAIANKCGVPFLKIAAPEIVSGMSGGQLVSTKRAVLSSRGRSESSAEIGNV